MENQKPILELKEVCKAFGGVIAASDVSFSVIPGEIVGLIGPNGAGKSTTLNLISGIYEVDKGFVYLDGVDVTNMAAHKRAHMGLARTFQSPRFLDRATLEENMMLGSDLYQTRGYLKSFFSKRNKNFFDEIEYLLEITRLHIDWKENIRNIPYGHLKLLEIVRALLSHPRIILVDEPAAGLNTKEVEQVVSLLHFATETMNSGIVLIEHSMDMVMNTCDSIVVLDFGKVIAKGLPNEIVSNSKVIEAYLGRKNYASD